ncbi:MAG: NAD-dependent epimerase/dehydratase family protein [Pseudomonadota bacterium]
MSMTATPPLVGITGATGFVGAALVDLLRAKGFRIRVLIRNRARLAVDPAGLEISVGDLGDADALYRFADGLDHGVHCAGLTHAKNRADFYRVNVEGAAALADAFARAGDHTAHAADRRFVHISSLAARVPAVSTYADSKSQSEAAVRDAITAGPGEPSSWVCLRAPALYGPRDTATLPFFKSVKTGIAPIPGGAQTRASILHVNDFACAVETALTKAVPGRLYEVGDQQPDGHSWSDIAHACAAGLGVSVRILPLPKALLSGWAFVSSSAMRLAGRAPMVTPEKIDEFFYPDWAARENLLADATDWHPQIALAAGFEQTARWYRDNQLL